MLYPRQVVEWLPIAVGGLLLAGMLRAWVRPNRQSGKQSPRSPSPLGAPPSSLVALARHLGLTLDGNTAFGTVSDTKVSLTTDEQGTVVLSASLGRPLQGITLVRPRAPDDPTRPAVAVGPGFDRVLVLRAQSARIAREELTGALGDALLRAALERLEPELESSTIRLRVPPGRPVHELRGAAEQLLAIARVAGPRTVVDPTAPAERRAIAAWKRIAAALGGKLAEPGLAFGIVRPEGTYSLELAPTLRAAHIELELVTPIATYLTVTDTEHAPEAMQSDDHLLGDDGFDAAFVVNGDPEEATRVLRPEARQALLALQHEGAAVQLAPTTLSVTTAGPPTDEHEIERLLEAMARVVEALTEREAPAAYR